MCRCAKEALSRKARKERHTGAEALSLSYFLSIAER
ncbi:hypothetical protein CGMCC3_g10093 [Colletotrichum fructicola]|nr:uncharacterized protein CGMCC3_g10093 [Colletotrichum fructicola]KAE9573815.1 hypothetical protein CGMCC3_g10093 [Colletotrichum fructicola]